MSQPATAIATRSRTSPKKPPQSAQTSLTYSERAEQYARDVHAKRILACVEVRQACKRHLDDLKRSRKRTCRWKFDPVTADRFCRFAEAFPHVKDDFLGHASRRERIRLEPWEIFIGCSIFGWVDKKKGHRRFSEAFIEVARKNGK